MWKVRELADKVTNVVMNYTEIESKVREATNDDPWGPTGALKHELAQATFSYDSFPEVMGMLWKRIAENKRSPRRIYKSLLLVHHLLLNGSDRVIRSTSDRLYEIRQLQDYHIVYEPGFNLSSIMPVDEYKDGELNVRVKAKEIVDLVQDEEKLKEERKKSKKNRDKYVGIGADRMTNRNWNSSSDFDDELKFPKSSGSKFIDDEEERTETGEEANESTNHTTEKKSPIKTKSPTTEEPKSSSKIQVKLKEQSSSPDKKVEDLEDDDFNPRAGEAAGDDSEFANFKSAFGATTTTTASSDLFHQVPAAANTGELDLLGLSIGTSAAMTNHHFGIGNFGPLSMPAGAAPITMSQPQSQPQDPFGSFGTNESDFVAPPSHSLQPQQLNNLNNNNAHQQSQSQQQQSKKTLEGTTWSDLNFSLDDLTLTSPNSSKSNKTILTNNAAQQPQRQQQNPTINQLINSSPTKTYGYGHGGTKLPF